MDVLPDDAKNSRANWGSYSCMKLQQAKQVS